MKIALVQRSSMIPWLTEEVRAHFAMQRFSDVIHCISGMGHTAWGAVVVSDRGSTPRAAIESVGRIKEVSPATPIVLLLGTSCEETAIAALHAGVREYLKGPITAGQLLEAVRRLTSAKDVRDAEPAGNRWIGESDDLRAMVEQGLFRRDLDYRLSVTHLDIPPLRSRREDILPLLDHFAETFARECGARFPGFSASAQKALLAYDWPGNVRELRNVVEELFVRLPDHPLQAEDLPFEVTGNHRAKPLEALAFKRFSFSLRQWADDW